MSMEDKVKELETSGDVKGLEAVKEEAELSFEGSIAGLAEQAITRLNAKAESAATTLPMQAAQVEKMDGSMGEVETRTADVNSEIAAVNAEATRQIEEVQESVSSSVEKPPVPPLPGKRVEAEAVGSTETAEDQNQKAFDEMRARFEQDAEKRSIDPENPINKVSVALSADKEILSKVARSMGINGANTSRLGINQVELEGVLPDLLEKGLISNEDYGIYIALSAYTKDSKPDMPRLNKLMETTPIKVLDKAAAESHRLGNVLDDWYAASQEEIAKEKTSPRKSDEKILAFISNAGRFSPKEELATLVPETVNGYLKNNPNIIRLRREDGTYPVINNLYEMGFSDEAGRILGRGLSEGTISNDIILEYQKKGYITEEQAKTMLDKAGRLS